VRAIPQEKHVAKRPGRSLTREQVNRLLKLQSDAVFGQRLLQDTPVLPEVWIAYGNDPDGRQELLLTPNSSSSVRDLVRALQRTLGKERGQDIVLLPYTESYVLVRASYRELIRCVLPLSVWWQAVITRMGGPPPISALDDLTRREDFVDLLLHPARQDTRGDFPESLLDLVRIAGGVALGQPLPPEKTRQKRFVTDAVHALREILDGADLDPLPADTEGCRPLAPLHHVNCNRRLGSAVWRSCLAVKADAAVRLFSISCNGLVWAVLDSGVDARHAAFSAKPGQPPPAGKDPSQGSRVRRTWDFTRLRDLLESGFQTGDGQPSALAELPEDERERISSDLANRLKNGQQLDWSLLARFLEVPHGTDYVSPDNEHGTHVAGILAADWPESAPKREEWIRGMCPDLDLYDLRVIGSDGQGDEFSLLAALQFLRYLNSTSDHLVVQGANLSFSLPHAVDSYACGSTPICEECTRLVGSGVVVVAAAGNRGYRSLGDNDGQPAAASVFEDYRNISITDPGNTDEVITVGSTHRFQPHKYGVSYFSSRGPTGDGRMKPDLVAPGEKIESTVPWHRGRKATLDGTSMAAPHVSGAAALLMARHRELIGRPARVKDILCRSATDLGRERSFQGAGMLDVLRALQSV
jgi:serine protease AprX